tara:strand:+ start:175341 stop:175865 length:525 start_codon:yes stop_codon:yes gene_type:complete
VIWANDLLDGYMPGGNDGAEKGKTASVYVSFIQGGSLKSAAFYWDDAEEAGLFDEHVYDLLDTIEGTPKKMPGRVADGISCSTCGFTLEALEEQGRLGCPQCYKTFGCIILPLLRKLHSGIEHMGKLPRKAQVDQVVNERILGLKFRMETAVSMERYEEAARFRDEIREIKERL